MHDSEVPNKIWETIMPTYDELKAELEAISKIVERFPEAVKPRVFELLVQTFLGQSLNIATHHTSITQAAPPTPQARLKSKAREKNKVMKPEEGGSEETKKTPKRGSAKESYSIDRELNLRGDKSIPGFKTFVEEKKPKSAKEFNAVVVYYLQKIAGLPQVSLNHAYTCYAEVQRRPPEAFRQSFIDTKNREGWVEFDAEGNLRIPHRGSVFVEHDLPRPEKAKKS